MSSSKCPFCAILSRESHTGDSLMIVFRDEYPISPGHTLIFPRRHVASVFDLTPEETREMWRQIRAAKQALREEFQPQGFNVGFNDGCAAGQTVMHAHLHVIPRYTGDTADPRGGIRHCIPGKGYYTAKE